MSNAQEESGGFVGEESMAQDAYEDDDEEFLFNEYSIDDTLDSLARLEKYYTSDFSLQRMVLVREIADTAREAGHENTVTRLLPLLPAFVNDSEVVVRQTLAEQIYPLAHYVCKEDTSGKDVGYAEVLKTLIPVTVELLIDKSSDVGNQAVQALGKICELVRPEDFETHVLATVKHLARDERAEDYRVVAALLCDELAPMLGRDLCLSRVVEEVTALADDTAFSVRKTVAGHLVKLCKAIGPEAAVEHVFPVYMGLCKDMIWSVRKACAESVADMSECVTQEVRTGALADIFKGFIGDVSRWVRVAAYQKLGPYLHTVGKDGCTPEMVQYFTQMATQSENGHDTDYAEYCAFSFPAVALTIGPERWDELRQAFQSLSRDVQWKVRKSLSFSVHEIAKIVGQEITEQCLADAVEFFMRDLDEVKVGCLQSIPEFLSHCGTEMREKFIPMVCTIPDQSDSWRMRMLVGSRLGDLAQLVRPEFVSEEIMKGAMKLVEDGVSDVRKAMYPSMAKVLVRLHEGNLHDELLKYMLSYTTMQSFHRRQMFPYMAMEVGLLPEGAELFKEQLLDPLLALARDPVANVRLVVAKCMYKGLMAVEPWKSHPRLLEAVAELQLDKDRDVSLYAGKPEEVPQNTTVQPCQPEPFLNQEGPPHAEMVTDAAPPAEEEMTDGPPSTAEPNDDPPGDDRGKEEHDPPHGSPELPPAADE
eukprot:Sspe_Gene.48272::Locus_25009_Transcript_1_1_Confidence_1.000_Length_2244::g.48272::m.48272/K15424/PPP4R1; serine/threonine-protein phosphatase 4 regulatory subunit 1